MLQKLQKHLDLNFPFLEGKRLFLAVSGGIDSMVLVHLLHKLNFKIAVLHCNFSLRNKESNEDEVFVKSVCNHLNIPVYIRKFDTKQFADKNKLSIQLAARKLRYDWFYEQLTEKQFDYVVTAHHLDDNLETFLINFTRGTGLAGLTGIPATNDKVIRPLLPFSREEILSYAKENNIQWREDSSNSSNKYFRNKLRHDVIPVLKELQSNLLSSFEDTLNHLQQSQSLVEDASKMFYEKIVAEEDNQLKFNLKELLKSPNYKAYLYQWLKEYGFTAWEDIYNLVNGQSGKQVFSPSYSLLKDRECLILSLKVQSMSELYLIEKQQKEVNIPLKISFCEATTICNTDSSTIFVDAEKLLYPLTIRKWEEGDYFYPFGMQGKKKVSKYFKDEKMSLIDKSNTWLLCSDNQIVWVIGKRQDERFKITTETTNKLQIQLQK